MRLLLLFFCTSMTSVVFGQYSQPQEISQSMAGPMFQFVLDFDADGDDEIFVYSNRDRKITIFENLGGGSFAEAYELDVSHESGSSIENVQIFDYDADSDLDIIAIINYQLCLFKNNSDGTFAPSEVIFSSFSDQDFLMFDVNGDSFRDIIYLSGGLAWKQYLGDGSYTSAMVIDEDFYFSFHYLNYGDIDGDGDFDLVTLSNGDLGKIIWYENNGEGFEDASVIATEINGYSHLNVVDFDNDGDNDILLTKHSSSLVLFYENTDGLGNFGDETILSDDFGSINAMTIVDIDNDLDLDIVLAQILGYGKTSVYLNDGLGGLETELVLGDYNGTKLISSDLNGDFYPELISTYFGEQTVCILNNELGTFGERICLHDNKFIENPNSLAVLDVNIDGDLDVLSTISGTNSLVWFDQTDYLEFSDFNIIDDDIPNAVAINTGDLDGDGLIDLSYASQSDGIIYWKKNLGDGTFGIRSTITSEVDEPNYLINYDFDDDGDLDVFSSSKLDDKIAWYENDGTGLFGPQMILSTTNNGPSVIKSGDIDGDGQIDISCISFIDDKLTWYKNMGDGTFSSENLISDEIIEGNCLYLSDLDGDLDLDILCAGFGSPYEIVWFENDGSGIFGPKKVIYSELSGSKRNMTVVSTDIDGDNDQDVLFTTYITPGSNNGLLYCCYNDGDANFSSPITVNFRSKSKMTALMNVDLDGDFDPDILYTDELREQVNIVENYYRDLYQVRGEYYVDINDNGIKDSLEPPVLHGQVLSTPETYFSYTYPSGLYLLNFDEELPGSYLVEPVVPDLWQISSDSDSYTIIIDDAFVFTDSMEFGITPETIQDTLSNEITGGFPRCNTIINYWLTINNEGTTVPSGTIHLTLDDQIEYVSSELTPDLVDGQDIYWSYDSLNYFDELTFNLQVEMPNFEAIGDTLTSVFMLTADSLDLPVFETSDTLRQLLVCAYDPNDKTAEPAGVDSLGYIPIDLEFIDYTVRFQNTGNDTAIHVRIEDQLDSNLQWHTLNPLASSHEMQVSVDPDGRIEFFFKEIMLPDSNVNVLGSQGFVKYRIYLDADLPSGTEINNTAEIYFDMNPPVITNTKIHTLFDCNHILESLVYDSMPCEDEPLDASLEVYFDGINTEWNIETIGIFTGPTPDWVADTSGIFDVSLNISTDFCEVDTSFSIEIMPSFLMNLDTIQICPGDSTLIYDSYETIEDNYILELNSIWGCDSIIETYLEVVIPPVTLESTNYCEGYGVIVFGDYVTESGTYYDTLSTYLGCDSIIEMEVYEIPTISTVDNIVSCPELSVLIFDEYTTEPGIYVDTLIAISGCDSISTVALVHLEVPDVNINSLPHDVICEEFSTYYLTGSPSGGTFLGPGISVYNQFSPSAAGVGYHTLYYSYEDDNGCVTTDSTYANVVSCLSLENSDLVKFDIYPNPAHENFIIEFPQNLSENYVIQITDMRGRSVKKYSVSGKEEISINTMSWSPGVYIINIYISEHNHAYTGRMVIE